MLYQLGGTQFVVTAPNVHEVAHDGEASFAEKSVMGRRPPLEFVGEGPESHTLQGKLFPERLGGLSSLSGLHSQRKAGKPLPLMRGDGTPLGWYVIERISERSSKLGPRGVGREIDVDITLKRSDPPSASSIFSIISGLI